VARACGADKFPTNDIMALLTPGNLTVGATNDVPRVMAMLYAGTDFVSRSAVPATPTRGVGGVAATRVCFSRGRGGPLRAVPRTPGSTTRPPGRGSRGDAPPPYASRGLPEELLALAPSL